MSPSLIYKTRLFVFSDIKSSFQLQNSKKLGTSWDLKQCRREREVYLDCGILEDVTDKGGLPNRGNKALILFHLTQKTHYVQISPQTSLITVVSHSPLLGLDFLSRKSP